LYLGKLAGRILGFPQHIAIIDVSSIVPRRLRDRRAAISGQNSCSADRTHIYMNMIHQHLRYLGNTGLLHKPGANVAPGGWLGQHAPGLQRWTLTCQEAPIPLKLEHRTGWLGQYAPRVATLDFDVSRGFDPTQARAQNGVAGAACPRVATLDFDLSEAPIPLKPEHRTGWLGQNAPGLQRWTLTFQRLRSHSSPRTERGGWGSMSQGCNAGL